MEPVTVLGLIWFTVCFLVVTLSIGEILRLFLHIIRFDLLRASDVADVVAEDMFLGLLGIPVIVLFLTLAGDLLTTLPAILIAVLCVVLAVGLNLRTTLRDMPIKAGGLKLADYLNRGRLSSTPAKIFIIILLAFILRQFILPGLYSPLGGDAKMWTFFSNNIVEKGGFEFGLGPNPYLALNQDFHKYLVGFPSLVAFFAVLLGTPVPESVLMVNSIVGAVTPLSVFYLVRKLMKSERWALYSGAFCAVLATALFDYFSWGGNGEFAAYALVPVVVVLMAQAPRKSSPVNYVVLLGLLAIVTIYHPYGLVYTICAVLPVILWRKPTSTWLVQTSVVLTLFAVVIVASFVGVFPAATSDLYTIGYWGWRVPIINTGQSPTDWIATFAYDFGLRYQSLTNSLLALIGFVVVYQAYRNKSKLALRRPFFALAWLTAIFLVHENNPFGAYFIQYPLWFIIFPERMILGMVMPIAILAGAGLMYVVDFAQKQIQRFAHTESKSTLSFLSGTRSLRKTVIGLAIVLLIIGPFTLPDIGRNVAEIRNDREFVSPIKAADAHAFDWISANLPESAIFITDEYDAGQYIPFYTGCEVRPPMLQVWRNFPDNLTALQETYIYTPDNATTVSLLHEYNISYVYIGKGQFYTNVPRFNVTLFLISSYYVPVYERDDVYIFKVL